MRWFSKVTDSILVLIVLKNDGSCDFPLSNHGRMLKFYLLPGYWSYESFENSFWKHLSNLTRWDSLQRSPIRFWSFLVDIQWFTHPQSYQYQMRPKARIPREISQNRNQNSKECFEGKKLSKSEHVTPPELRERAEWIPKPKNEKINFGQEFRCFALKIDHFLLLKWFGTFSELWIVSEGQ